MQEANAPDLRKAVRLLLIFLVVAASGAIGCEVKDTGQTANPAVPDEVFISDDVARVVIYMKPTLWDNLLSRAKDEEYKRADFWFDGKLVSGVAVRAKGSSTLTYVVDDGSDRLSLKVDFDMLYNPLNFHGLKKLNFHNNYRDPALMRERLAYELFAQMGVPAPRATHVDLWVNDTHMGLYTQVEHIDEIFLARNFENCHGDLYKPNLSSSYLNWSGRQLEHINEMEVKTNERLTDHAALLRFLDVLNNEPDETFPQEIEKVLDVDEALRFLAVETMLVCLDSYQGRGVNYYLYENDGRFVIIPWDLNESFGTYKCGLDKDDIINFYIDEPTCGPIAERPLVDRLLSCKPYLEIYHGYLQELLDGPFSVDSMDKRIEELADMIRPYVENDELKFHSTAEFEQNLTDDVGRYFGLKSFVAERGESVRLQLAGELPRTGDGAGNSGDPDKA